ncbi:NAD(P)H-dependent oxidoreductase [Halobacillus litoralis]|uniref:NAD(P)H-dependent oxidoreductase n=1 Tax=Halobacillus litoralis TaxID=45668 RepID=A0A845E2Q9_9BACI|nr:NAD(P)H-dependent oxidoreductase [Halobacillus litoralis]MYL50004.1 NAD(P)H-dependent oxidoreductase [Halobacillus litoralis]
MKSTERKMDMLEIAAICGSLRKDSFNKKLLEAVERESKGKWKIKFVEINRLPLFNEDIEKGGDPEEVAIFKEKLKGADGTLIITPEYNSGMPGGLKNALDWASRPVQDSVFKNTPAAVAGASPGRAGTALAQMQLRQTLVAMEANVMSGPKVLVGEVHKIIDSETNQITDPRTLSNLQSLIHGFTAFVEMYQKEQ